jgi:uncharacterized membrane protein YeaQ/YmgE (transglycosylase-associated protein family)
MKFRILHTSFPRKRESALTESNRDSRFRGNDGVVEMDTKNIVIAVIMGIAAGWLASWVVGGYGIVQYLISGVLGSFVGSYALNAAKINLGIRNEIGRDIATATIGAIIVMLIARILH